MLAIFTMQEMWSGGDVSPFSKKRNESRTHEELRGDVGLESLLPVLMIEAATICF
jgi:hypothetical protein